MVAVIDLKAGGKLIVKDDYKRVSVSVDGVEGIRIDKRVGKKVDVLGSKLFDRDEVEETLEEMGLSFRWGRMDVSYDDSGDWRYTGELIIEYGGADVYVMDEYQVSRWG